MIPDNLSSEVVGKRFFHYYEEYPRFWAQRIKETLVAEFGSY